MVKEYLLNGKRGRPRYGTLMLWLDCTCCEFQIMLLLLLLSSVTIILYPVCSIPAAVFIIGTIQLKTGEGEPIESGDFKRFTLRWVAAGSATCVEAVSCSSCKRSMMVRSRNSSMLSSPGRVVVNKTKNDGTMPQDKECSAV